MHWQGTLTLCIIYFLLSTTVAQSLNSLSPTPSETNAILIAGSKVDSSSDNDSSSTPSHTGTSTRTHTPITPWPSHSSHFTHFTYHTWQPPPPTASPSLSGGSTQTPPHPLSQLAVAGIVVGTLAALVIGLGILRCWWHWKKTPQRNRIEALLHRYQLDREMGEAAVEPIRARVPRPPPPPYRPPPPGYDDSLLSPSTPPISHPSPTHSPNHSRHSLQSLQSLHSTQSLQSRPSPPHSPIQEVRPGL